MAAFVAFLVVSVSGPVLASPAPSAVPGFVVDQAYEALVENTLVSYGTWPGYGFRAAGSSADNAAAAYIAEEMEDIGLKDVRLEGVPVDAWEFGGASLTVSGNGATATFTASSMGGVPGTPPKGLTGEIVYVGRGTPGEYPSTGVGGKLLLVDWDADWFWVNLIANQATLDGAKGVIISTMNHPAYYARPDSLGSFDATYDLSWVPLIVISRNDGFALMDMMAQGPVTGTMVSKVKITLAEKGGMGYNTVGVLPGADHAHPILILGHHDAWFTGASDDTSAIAGMLAWAKALAASGYTPTHDLIFIATTGEEYGNTDAYYEWLVGAWYMITNAHPEWATSAIAFLNIEGLGGRGTDGSSGPFTARTNYELAPLVRQVFGANRALLPNGWSVFTALSSWQDGWTLTAAGIPGITFGVDKPGYDAVYHTNFDDLSLIHYDDMALQVQVMQKVLVAIDTAAVLPYTFTERADDIANSVDASGYGVADVPVSALREEISEFRALARKYDRARTALGPEEAAAANALLLEVSQLINREWTGLSVWDDVIYPTQQVEWDTVWLAQAIQDLGHGDLKHAINTLWNVGLTWNAFFDYPVWKWENDRHALDAPHLNWGAQGHLPPYVDIYDAFQSLRAKYATGGTDFTAEIAALQAVLDSERTELAERVIAETLQVMEVNEILTGLIGMAA